MRVSSFFAFLLILAPPLAACAKPAIQPAAQPLVCPAPKAMHFAVEGRIVRNVAGFTEGLEVRNGDLYESTGSMYGASRLLRMAPDGRVTVLADFGGQFFGEGLTILHDRIYQLTWRDRKVFVYDLQGSRIRTMRNPREGWGLTNDGTHLIFDDGSATIFFAEPEKFTVSRQITVRRIDEPVEQLNELEYVDGKLYANIFMERTILRIDPVSGCVEAEAQLDNLWGQMSKAERDRVNSDSNFVLNGIAYDPARRLFFLTGKVWPMVFTGRFIEN